MTRLSNFPLKPATTDKFTNDLFRTVYNNRSSKEVEIFLNHLLTPVEIETFAKRLQIFKALRSGTTYLEIGDEIKVTGATISKMNNILRKAGDNFLKFLDYLIEKDNAIKQREKEEGFTKGSKQLYKQRLRR